MKTYKKAVADDANPETLKLVTDEGAEAIKLEADKAAELVDTLVAEWTKIQEAGQDLADKVAE